MIHAKIKGKRQSSPPSRGSPINTENTLDLFLTAEIMKGEARSLFENPALDIPKYN